MKLSAALFVSFALSAAAQAEDYSGEWVHRTCMLKERGGAWRKMPCRAVLADISRAQSVVKYVLDGKQFYRNKNELYRPPVIQLSPEKRHIYEDEKCFAAVEFYLTPRLKPAGDALGLPNVWQCFRQKRGKYTLCEWQQ